MILESCDSRFAILGAQLSGKKKAHKLKKILRTPAGSPWDTRREKQGSTGRCPRNFLLFTIEKLRILPGHRPGVPGTPGRPGGFQKFDVIFAYVPFLLPKLVKRFLTWSHLQQTQIQSQVTGISNRKSQRNLSSRGEGNMICQRGKPDP